MSPNTSPTPPTVTPAEFRRLVATLGVTEQVITNESAQRDLADKLWQSGQFTERTGAAEFVSTLVMIALGRKPITAALSDYLTKQASVVAQLAEVATARAKAASQQSLLDSLLAREAALAEDLKNEGQTLAWLKEQHANLDSIYQPGARCANFAQVLQVGAHVLSIKETLRIVEAAHTRLESQLSEARSALDTERKAQGIVGTA